ncbi:phosphatase PAP2 family protein [Natronolimnobius sp. AArcel1]|uniref:phosphatase PAP2 family protein n=1 Tax=Natronolimnobius sp. AArcel1 TaxID=1679093 RepID=UPI0013EAE9FD|nr:phosphatase PAP2 family protein [Natronolimnobius sp. AArcel1]NGM71586.1 phosphatase PAP2 family protein [Natronolimnobius sp. AArcel1]
MGRGIGEFELIQGSIPDWLAVVFALLTQLGDIWFLVLVLTVLYWFDARERDDVATVAGVTLAGMGLYKGLKEVFGLPRPEQPLLDPTHLPALVQPLYEATATVGGYGFPSGHAVNTTVVYFGLATVLSISTVRRRYALAGILVTVVSFTRVALGVHYLVDVVVGVLVGFALLGAAWVLLEREFSDRPTIAFALGIGFCAFFFVTSDGTRDALFLLAGSFGAFAGWQLVMLARGPMAGTEWQFSRALALRGGAAVLVGAALIIAVATTLVSLMSAAGLVGLATILVVVGPVARDVASA